MIDVEALRTNSLQWLEKSEVKFMSLSAEKRAKERLEYEDQVSKYDADTAWALYCFPNKAEYLRRTLKYLDLKPDDVLLDIGAGDGRLSILALQEFKIKEAIAIEWSKEWVDETNRYVRENGGFPENMTYQQDTYQDFDFPVRITKCVFLAHHNGDITKLNILKKLSRTMCRIFVHNFGKPKLLSGEVLNQR